MEIFKNAISHNGLRYDVEYYDASHFDDVPDELILKSHAVCFWDGKMLLVNHPQWNIWGIPGGTREANEPILETLKREILEETNCETLDFTPVGYLKVISPDGDVHYRTQYICNVKPLGEFESDPAGNIDKIMWINPAGFGKYIEEKEHKRIVIEKALDLYRKLNSST